MAQTLQWEAPPVNAVAGGERNTKWGGKAGLLRANKGEWAVVAVKNARAAAVTLTNGIAAGRKPEFEPAGAYESAYAEQHDGTFKVFARFLGDDAAAAAATNGSAPAEDDGDDWDADEAADDAD